MAAEVLVYRDNNFEKALALMDKVSDSDSYNASLLKTIRSMRVAKAIQDGDAEKAYRYNKDAQDANSRASYLMAIARLFGKSGNIERAKATLREAQQLLDTEPNKAHEMLDRARVAAEINPALGFQAMKEAIEAINASDFSLEANGYSSGEDRKIDFSYRHDFDENLTVLARADFDRALELAKSIKPKEVSLLAQFAVCKGALINSARTSR